MTSALQILVVMETAQKRVTVTNAIAMKDGRENTVVALVCKLFAATNEMREKNLEIWNLMRTFVPQLFGFGYRVGKIGNGFNSSQNAYRFSVFNYTYLDCFVILHLKCVGFLLIPSKSLPLLIINT